MTKRILLTLLLLFVVADQAFSQRNRGANKGSIQGQVVDSILKKPVEYASIMLYGGTDSTQIDGTVTNDNGFFKLSGVKPGNYFMQIHFIGYQMKTIDTIEIKPKSANIRLGVIPLVQFALEMEDIEVIAKKPGLVYEIDKKVIHVSEQYTAHSGTAVDVLENVPSIRVDIEGNVRLRGSASFTVLIDNRPSVLQPSDALQQIPASMIETIEIITNPSAKYDPDGISGIININTRRGEIKGLNGIINLNAGRDEKHGGDFLFYHRNKTYNTFFGANFKKKYFLGSTRNENQTIFNEINSFTFSDGNSRRGRSSLGIRGGIELFLGSRDILSFGARYGQRISERDSDLSHDEWTETEIIHILYNSNNRSKRSGGFYTANVDYQHKFEKKDHKLSGQLIFSHRDTDEESLNERLDVGGNLSGGRQTTEDGPSNRVRTRLDYSLPLGEVGKLESGYQGRFGTSEDITKLFDYNPDRGEYEIITRFNRSTEYTRNIHSLYTIYSGKLEKFGYQAGIRGEYTDRVVELHNNDDNFGINRWDYFPTTHVSYQFLGQKQIMASYTRRIERPRGWHLEPFETWTNANNVRKGNPDLKPEYIDSYELGYQIPFGKNLFANEVYYRVNHNKVERVRSVYDKNITLRSFENVGTDYAFGSEFMLNFDMRKWWDITFMANLYNYRVEGILSGVPFSQESFNWRLQLNNDMNWGKSTRVQINGTYNSPTVLSQGRSEGFFIVNFAIKQELIDETLTAILQVNDLFETSKSESTSSGLDFYSYHYSTRRAPVIMFNLSYNLNNSKPDRRRKQEDIDEDDF